jgi:RNA polymerase sigma-70 factor (ECF subfamily)
MQATDIELMLRVQEGDVAAFQQLVTRYRDPLRRFFASLLADRSQADDFAQETFLRLWLARDRYEPSGKFSTYLFQIGRRYWLNQRRKIRPQVSEENVEDALTVRALS